MIGPVRGTLRRRGGGLHAEKAKFRSVCALSLRAFGGMEAAPAAVSATDDAHRLRTAFLASEQSFFKLVESAFNILLIGTVRAPVLSAA